MPTAILNCRQKSVAFGATIVCTATVGAPCLSVDPTLSRPPVPVTCVSTPTGTVGFAAEGPVTRDNELQLLTDLNNGSPGGLGSFGPASTTPSPPSSCLLDGTGACSIGFTVAPTGCGKVPELEALGFSDCYYLDLSVLIGAYYSGDYSYHSVLFSENPRPDVPAAVFHSCWFAECLINHIDSVTHLPTLFPEPKYDDYICLFGNLPTPLSDCKLAVQDLTEEGITQQVLDNNKGILFPGPGMVAAAANELAHGVCFFALFTCASAGNTGYDNVNRGIKYAESLGYTISDADKAILLADASYSLSDYCIVVISKNGVCPDEATLERYVRFVVDWDRDLLHPISVSYFFAYVAAELAVSLDIGCGGVHANVANLTPGNIDGSACSGAALTATVLANHDNIQAKLIPFSNGGDSGYPDASGFSEPSCALPFTSVFPFQSNFFGSCRHELINRGLWGGPGGLVGGVGWSQVNCILLDLDINGTIGCPEPSFCHDAWAKSPSLASLFNEGCPVPGSAGSDNSLAPIRCATGPILDLSIGYDGDVSFSVQTNRTSNDIGLAFVNKFNFRAGSGGGSPRGVDVEIAVADREQFLPALLQLKKNAVVDICGRFVTDTRDYWNELHPVTSLTVDSPPKVKATTDRAPDMNGWYNHPVQITWTGSEPLGGGYGGDGVQSCDPPTTYSGPSSLNGIATIITGHCTDLWGNVGTGIVFIPYDSTPPTTTTTADPPPNSNGWNNRDVSITLGPGNDADSGWLWTNYTLSGAQTGSGTFYPSNNEGCYIYPPSCYSVIINTEGITTVSYHATDFAGNKESWSEHMVCQLPQPCTTVISPLPCPTGPITPLCTPVEPTLVVKIDKTPPVVTGQPDRPPDRNGWYNHPLTVTWNGTDNLSGIQSCSPPGQYSGPDGQSLGLQGPHLIGSCTDLADNSAFVIYPFNYDSSPPTITSGQDGQSFILNSVVVPVASCSDGTGIAGLLTQSGIDTCNVPSGLLDTSTVGNHSYIVSAMDRAGNSATLVVNYRVIYHFIGPFVSKSNLNLNETVRITFQLTDATGTFVSTGIGHIWIDSLTSPGIPVSHGGTTGNVFAYRSNLNTYQFKLSTLGLVSGVHTIYITLDDGTTYSTTINIA